MPILFGQIHSEIKISLHGALRISAGKTIEGVSNIKTKRRVWKFMLNLGGAWRKQ